MAASEPARLAPGTMLGHYCILDTLGAGGMGEVYRALDSRLEREVAIKVLPRRLAEDADSLARFEREAKVVAALSHPNILAIHDYGSGDGLSYAVMELLQGQTLRERVSRGGLPWRKAAELGALIADALAAAHAKGVVHRDLKPTNVFLTSDGQLKVLDFGLARWEPPGAAVEQMEVTQAALAEETSPGTVLGTVGYMSPEQVRGERTDGRSDIFALGCVLYEMVSGVPPFARDTAADAMAAVLKEDPQDLADSGKKVPPEMSRVIAHCLEKHPDQRFQSARDLAFDLRVLASSSEVSRVAPAEERTPLRRVRLPLSLAAAGLALAGLLSWWLVNGRSGPVSALAVLPFANATGDAETEYLSDGLTDSLIHSLSRLPGLRVMARGTVFTYKGREVDPRKVGRDLGVDAVLTGRLTQRGDMLALSTELVSTRDGSQVWGEQYTRPMADLADLQRDLEREISQQLRVKLTGQDRQRLAQQQPVNAESYKLLLKGRFSANKRTEEGLRKGIELFERALEAEPGYALAWSGLADCYQLLGLYSMLPPREAMPKAKAAAEKALRLDDGLAEAHTSLAYVLLAYDWDWAGAEREFRRAIELNPNYATAHHWYAEYFTTLGLHDEALRTVRRAQELDPLSLPILRDVGWHLYFARRYDEAAAESRKALDLDAGYSPALTVLGRALEQQRRHEEALAAFRRARSARDTPITRTFLAHAYALAGRRQEAEEEAREVERAARERYVPPYYLAAMWAGLGEPERALAALERAREERFYLMTYLKVDPRLDPLRSHPGFAELLLKVGFTS